MAALHGQHDSAREHDDEECYFFELVCDVLLEKFADKWIGHLNLRTRMGGEDLLRIAVRNGLESVATLLLDTTDVDGLGDTLAKKVDLTAEGSWAVVMIRHRCVRRSIIAAAALSRSHQ